MSGYEAASGSQLGASAGQSAGAGLPGRAQELRPFIQQQCNQAVRDMAAALSQQLHEMGEPSMDLEGGKLVEQALLIGTEPSESAPYGLSLAEFFGLNHRQSSLTQKVNIWCMLTVLDYCMRGWLMAYLLRQQCLAGASFIHSVC